MGSGLAARYASLKPAKKHVALPLLIMAALYATSSLPGTPAPDETDVYVLLWIAPGVQNVLHVPVYAALAWSWHWAFRAWVDSAKATAIGACTIALAYGALDEWHQSFVPGRLASLTDIALNAVGTALGMWLAARATRREQE